MLQRCKEPHVRVIRRWALQPVTTPCNCCKTFTRSATDAGTGVPCPVGVRADPGVCASVRECDQPRNYDSGYNRPRPGT